MPGEARVCVAVDVGLPLPARRVGVSRADVLGLEPLEFLLVAELVGLFVLLLVVEKGFGKGGNGPFSVVVVVVVVAWLACWDGLGNGTVKRELPCLRVLERQAALTLNFWPLRTSPTEPSCLALQGPSACGAWRQCWEQGCGSLR